MIFYNEHNNIINIDVIEKPEQDLAKKYILPNDTVLELGARYGTVSCVINSKLFNKLNQVSVEPDDRVWDALEKNMLNNNCYFNIVKGFISKIKINLFHKDRDYGTTYFLDENTNINCYSMEYIKKTYNIKHFSVLVADCEGGLELFLYENPELYTDLRLIIFEADYPNKCNYDLIRHNLKINKFIELEKGHQNVWIKNN